MSKWTPKEPNSEARNFFGQRPRPKHKDVQRKRKRVSQKWAASPEEFVTRLSRRIWSQVALPLRRSEYRYQKCGKAKLSISSGSNPNQNVRTFWEKRECFHKLQFSGQDLVTRFSRGIWKQSLAGSITVGRARVRSTSDIMIRWVVPSPPSPAPRDSPGRSGHLRVGLGRSRTAWPLGGLICRRADGFAWIGGGAGTACFENNWMVRMRSGGRRRGCDRL